MFFSAFLRFFVKKTDLIPFVVVVFCVYLVNWQGDVVFWGCKRVRRLANSCVNRLVGIVFFGHHPVEWRVIWTEAGGLLWFCPWTVVVLPVNW